MHDNNDLTNATSASLTNNEKSEILTTSSSSLRCTSCADKLFVSSSQFRREFCIFQCLPENRSSLNRSINKEAYIPASSERKAPYFLLGHRYFLILPREAKNVITVFQFGGRQRRIRNKLCFDQAKKNMNEGFHPLGVMNVLWMVRKLEMRKSIYMYQ